MFPSFFFQAVACDKVEVLTDDDRQLGVIRFNVVADESTEPRAFKIEKG